MGIGSFATYLTAKSRSTPRIPKKKPENTNNKKEQAPRIKTISVEIGERPKY